MIVCFVHPRSSRSVVLEEVLEVVCRYSCDLELEYQGSVGSLIQGTILRSSPRWYGIGRRVVPCHKLVVSPSSYQSQAEIETECESAEDGGGERGRERDYARRQHSAHTPCKSVSRATILGMSGVVEERIPRRSGCTGECCTVPS